MVIVGASSIDRVSGDDGTYFTFYRFDIDCTFAPGHFGLVEAR